MLDDHHTTRMADYFTFDNVNPCFVVFGNIAYIVSTDEQGKGATQPFFGLQFHFKSEPSD